MSGLLQGKTAIVTGASSGIGAATAELFVKEGATVLITARRQDKLDLMADKLTELGGSVVAVASDVGDPQSVREVFAKAVEIFGHVDILVNNAGTTNLLGIDTTSDEEWARVITVNQSSVFYFCREAVKHMVPRDTGCIVNVGSMNGIRPLSGFAFSVSKFAVSGITQGTALRLSGTGVRCNAICPGPTNPAMSEALQAGSVGYDQHIVDQLFAKLDLKAPGSEAIAQAKVILFLASEAASDINGAIIPVDKGIYL